MLVTTALFAILTQFVCSSNLNVHGYVLDVTGNTINWDSYFRSLFIAINFPKIDNDTASGGMQYDERRLAQYFVSFHLELNNIDNENATKFMSLYKDYQEFNPNIISQKMNEKAQNSYTLFSNQYFVITAVQIVCNINMDETNLNYPQINQLCNENISDGRLFITNNETFLSMPYYNYDVAIIHFFTNGNGYIHVHGNTNIITGGISLQETQYDLFYPNRQRTENNPCEYYTQLTNDSYEEDVIILLQYKQCNVQILYNENATNFISDIKQTGTFDINLMNDEYKDFSHNGSFIYYGIGGICSGIFCIEEINWMRPEITTSAPTPKPTRYPTLDLTFSPIYYGYDDSDGNWWIIGLVVGSICVLGCVGAIGAIIYQQNKNRKPRNNNITYNEVPIDVLQATNVHTQES